MNKTLEIVVFPLYVSHFLRMFCGSEQVMYKSILAGDWHESLGVGSILAAASVCMVEKLSCLVVGLLEKHLTTNDLCTFNCDIIWSFSL